MSKSGHKTQRRRKDAKQAAELPVVEFLRGRLTNPDPRTHSDFLTAYRARQRAGELNNPAATGPLLDRLERSISA